MLTLDKTNLYYCNHILQILSISNSNVNSSSKYGGLTGDQDWSFWAMAPHTQSFWWEKHWKYWYHFPSHTMFLDPSIWHQFHYSADAPLAPNPPHPHSHPHSQSCPPTFRDMSNNNLIIVLDEDDSSYEPQHEMIKPLPASGTANHDMDVENYNLDIEESHVRVDNAEHDDLVINSPAASWIQSEVSANVIIYIFTLTPDEQELGVVKESMPLPQIHPQCSVFEKYMTQALSISANNKWCQLSTPLWAFKTHLGTSYHQNLLHWSSNMGHYL